MQNIDFGQTKVVQTHPLSAADAARASAWARVHEGIDEATRSVADVPLAEQLTWGAKETEARAILKDAMHDCAILRAETAVTGEALADLAVRVVRKANAYRTRIGALTGLRRRALADIAVAKTVRDIDKAMARFHKDMGPRAL